MSDQPFLVRRQREVVIVLAGLVLGAGAVAAALEPAQPLGPNPAEFQEPFSEDPGFQGEFEFEFEEPPVMEAPPIPDITIPPQNFDPPSVQVPAQPAP